MGKNKLQTKYGRMVISRFACLRVLGENIALHLKQFGIKNTIVSDNGVVPMNPILAENTYDGTNIFRILFVGTLSRQKGFSTLVKACVNLASKGAMFEVHAMGEWMSEKYRREIENELRDQKAERHFIFHGLTHGRQKRQIFSRALKCSQIIQIHLIPRRIFDLSSRTKAAWCWRFMI